MMLQMLKQQNKKRQTHKYTWFFAVYFGLMALGALPVLWDVRAAAAAGAATGGVAGWISLALVVCFVMCVVAAYAAHSGWPGKKGRRVLRVLCWLAAAGSAMVMAACLLAPLLFGYVA